MRLLSGVFQSKDINESEEVMTGKKQTTKLAAPQPKGFSFGVSHGIKSSDNAILDDIGISDTVTSAPNKKATRPRR
jgi:hypothetical protein